MNRILFGFSLQCFLLCLASGRNLQSQQGCCSWHGGVCGCSGGQTLCCDEDDDFVSSCSCGDGDDDDDDDNYPWTPAPTIQSQQGCCSWHGGVRGCSGGRTLCCDGEFSPSCLCGDDYDDENQCAPSPTPMPALRPTRSPTPGPTPKSTPPPTPKPTPTTKPTPPPAPEPTPLTPLQTTQPTPLTPLQPAQPTPAPTPKPTNQPTPSQTPGPIPPPNPSPTSEPTPLPTSEPTPGPTTESPTPRPTRFGEATEPSQSVLIVTQNPTSTPPMWAIGVMILLVFLLGLVSGWNLHYLWRKLTT